MATRLMSTDRAWTREGSIIGGWPLFAFAVTVLAAWVAVLKVVDGGWAALLPIVGALLACGGSFTLGHTTQVIDIRRRAFVPVSALVSDFGDEGKEERARLLEIFPTAQKLGWRARNALAVAWSGWLVTGLAGWWPRRSAVDGLLVAGITALASWLSTVLGSLATRKAPELG